MEDDDDEQGDKLVVIRKRECHTNDDLCIDKGVSVEAKQFGHTKRYRATHRMKQDSKLEYRHAENLRRGRQTLRRVGPLDIDRSTFIVRERRSFIAR